MSRKTCLLIYFYLKTCEREIQTIKTRVFMDGSLTKKGGKNRSNKCVRCVLLEVQNTEIIISNTKS